MNSSIDLKGTKIYIKIKDFLHWILTELIYFLSDGVPEDQFDVELIVQCIRSSESPQTHNQALLLLAAAAKLFPVSYYRSNCFKIITCM